MDLLGDIGHEDQLTSARTENAMLQKRVQELTEQVKKLRVENESLKAEVEMYRKEAAVPGFSNLALGKSNDNMMTDDEVVTDFVKSGDGTFPKENQVTLSHLHGSSNPLCCALSLDDTVLATGGADKALRLVPWGTAWTEDDQAAERVVESSVSAILTESPVICVAFSPVMKNVLAAGGMDGSIVLCEYQSVIGQSRLQLHATNMTEDMQKHRKYVRAMVWSPVKPLLATASADGSVHVYNIEKPSMMDDEMQDLIIAQIRTLHLSGSVESLCFLEKELVCYARDTPYLSYFDVDDNFKQTQLNINTANPQSTSGGFDEHVSFAIMDMALSPNGKYLAVATDASRNIVWDLASRKQIRNLYGHKNDGFSQPKLAWSSNGQYIAGNTQDDSCVCVWDISSGQIVDRLRNGHQNTVRDLVAGHTMDCWVTTSFDKQTKLWFAPIE